MKPTIIVLATLIAMGCEARPSTPTTKPTETAGKTGPAKPPPPPKQTPITTRPVEPPETAKPATFEELWKEVGSAVTAMEKTGTDDLKSSEKLLTDVEKFQREGYIKIVQDSPQRLADAEITTRCDALRLQKWVEGIGARAGYSDNEFKNVARVLYPPPQPTQKPLR